MGTRKKRPANDTWKKKKKKKKARKKNRQSSARAALKNARSPAAAGDDKPIHERFARSVAPDGVTDPEKRKAWGLPEDDRRPGRYIIELNLTYEEGLECCAQHLDELLAVVVDASDRKKSTPLSRTYRLCLLTVEEVMKLVRCDDDRSRWRLGEQEGQGDAGKKTIWPMKPAAPKLDGDPKTANRRHHRVIYRLWPDFQIQAHVDRSNATVKSDAALRSFEAGGRGIVWAIVDSGVEADHPHFGGRDGAPHLLRHPSVHGLHRSFLEDNGKPPVRGDPLFKRWHQARALKDQGGHGTHVAGIVAGCAPPRERRGTHSGRQLRGRRRAKRSSQGVPNAVGRRCPTIARGSSLHPAGQSEGTRRAR